MDKNKRHIERKSYVAHAWVAVALLVASLLLFPFLVRAIALSTCTPNTGSCGAIAVVLGIYLKPLVLLVPAIYLAVLVWRRATTVGLSQVLGLAVPLLMFLDFQFYLLFGGHWGLAMAMGFPTILLPLNTIVMLGLVVMLAMLPKAPQSSLVATLPAKVLGATIFLLGVSGILAFILPAVALFHYIKFAMALLALVVMAWNVVASRRKAAPILSVESIVSR